MFCFIYICESILNSEMTPIEVFNHAFDNEFKWGIQHAYACAVAAKCYRIVIRERWDGIAI